MRLTSEQIRNVKPGNKIIKLFDGWGMYLLVTPKGYKWWRLKYYFEGKERLLALGVYPQVSLKQARKLRDDAKIMIFNGIDPLAYKKEQKQQKKAQALEV